MYTHVIIRAIWMGIDNLGGWYDIIVNNKFDFKNKEGCSF